MFNPLLQKYRNQVRRALEAHKWERQDDGLILLPELKMRLGGNLVVNEGLSLFLVSTLAQGAQVTALFVAPFSGNVEPAASLTAATFTATMTEFTNYTQSARVAWAKDAESGQAIGNATTPSAFTIGSGGGTIWGAALVSASAKSSTAGKLVSCGKFAASRVLLAADALNLTYLFSASDASA